LTKLPWPFSPTPRVSFLSRSFLPVWRSACVLEHSPLPFFGLCFRRLSALIFKSILRLPYFRQLGVRVSTILSRWDSLILVSRVFRFLYYRPNFSQMLSRCLSSHEGLSCAFLRICTGAAVFFLAIRPPLPFHASVIFHLFFPPFGILFSGIFLFLLFLREILP